MVSVTAENTEAKRRRGRGGGRKCAQLHGSCADETGLELRVWSQSPCHGVLPCLGLSVFHLCNGYNPTCLEGRHEA